MAFDDLTEAQQEKLLAIADAEIAKDEAIEKFKQDKQNKLNSKLKKFLSRDEEFSESQVPTANLNYDANNVQRVQNISGKYLERAVITMTNYHAVTITRPQQVYGSDPSIFDVSVTDPAGNIRNDIVDPSYTSNNVIANQKISDINGHIKKVHDFEPKTEDEEDNTEEDDS